MLDHDENGVPIYAQYRVPDEVHMATPKAPAQQLDDASWVFLIEHWRLVIADLRKEEGIDLYSSAVLAGSWLTVRSAIFSLLDSPTRLRSALTRR